MLREETLWRRNWERACIPVRKRCIVRERRTIREILFSTRLQNNACSHKSARATSTGFTHACDSRWEKKARVRVKRKRSSDRSQTRKKAISFDGRTSRSRFLRLGISLVRKTLPPRRFEGEKKEKARKIGSYRQQRTVMERAGYEAGARRGHFVPPVNPRELAFLFHYHYFSEIT
jgi:myosin heavy subunit